MSTQTYVGVADCHGIESFVRKDRMSTDDCAFRIMRAAANQQRLAVYYEADLESASIKMIDGYLDKGKYGLALEYLKRLAVELRAIPEYEEHFNKIPNPDLDPYA